jgi:TDG/mug DNA glycosylase family protein
MVERATASAAEISATEYRAGGDRLREKVLEYRPRVLAVLGVTAYRLAFARPRARLGAQEETIGNTRLWVLPSPSGLNAHVQLPELAEMFRQLRSFAAGLGEEGIRPAGDRSPNHS